MRVLFFLMSFFFFFSKEVLATINFQISNFEKVNDYYSVDALITTSATSSAYFVQAMFTPTDSNNYFGYTWSQKGDWFKYISSPDKEFIQSDFPILAGNTTQKILFKPDTESSKYHGPGEYLLKLKRYTGESSSGTYSDNSLTVTLSDPTSLPTVTPTITSTTTQTPTATQTTSPVISSIQILTPPTPTSVKTTTPISPSPSLRPSSKLEEGKREKYEAILATISSEILGASISASVSESDFVPLEPTDIVKQPIETNTKTALAVGLTTLGLLGIIFYRLLKIKTPPRSKTPSTRGVK